MVSRWEYPIAGSEATIVDIVHDDGHAGRWSHFRPETVTGLCLPRSGGFYRDAEGQLEFVDATTGHFVRAGVEERFLKPIQPAFRITVIELNPDIYAAHIDGADVQHTWALPTHAALDMRHRALLAACARRDDPFEEFELLCQLLQELPPHAQRHGKSAPQTRASHRRLANRAKEALTHGHLNCGLEDLARLVGSSPHHLSRIFRQETGRTLTSYRIQLRMQAVLDDFAVSTGTLADLAAVHGFADHAHLTRTFRRYHGEVPSTLRTLLNQTDNRTQRV